MALDLLTAGVYPFGVDGLYRAILAPLSRAHDAPGIYYFNCYDSSGNKVEMFWWLDSNSNIRWSTAIPTDQDADGSVLISGATGSVGLVTLTGYFEYTDTAAKTLFALPAGATLLNVGLSIETTFDGTTPTLDVGLLSGTGDEFYNGVAGGVAGLIGGFGSGADPAGSLGLYAAADSVTGKFISGGGTPSQGKARVFAMYVMGG